MLTITRCDRSLQSICTATDADSGPECSFGAGIERVVVIIARTIWMTRDGTKAVKRG